MRTLVLCSSCRRQYDATGGAPGTRLRCRCGATIQIPAPRPRDAAVVRCSSCGAAREAGAASCNYCGSDFTLHERDLHTLCPSCMTRISDRARFCHHCATPITPEEPLGEPTDRACPACDAESPLRSRILGHSELSSLECGRCAGLWLGAEAFERLLSRARDVRHPAPDPSSGTEDPGPRPPDTSGRGPMYRPCPVCSRRMNRSNFGRSSGVVIDRCRDHGIWFDATELDRVLRWVRNGGEALEAERRLHEERMAASAARFRVEPKAPDDTWRGERSGDDQPFDLLPWIIRFFTDR